MKRASRITPLVACVSIILMLLGSACEKDSTEFDATPLLGTWHQTSRTINGALATKDSTRLVLQINSTNICIMCDSTFAAKKAKTIIKRSGWNYSGGLLNIAIDLPVSWNVTTDANKLSLQRIDFNQQGSIIKTVIGFESITNIEIE